MPKINNAKAQMTKLGMAVITPNPFNKIITATATKAIPAVANKMVTVVLDLRGLLINDKRLSFDFKTKLIIF
jgi:hypothetical protein